jgi:hypothetical protein
LGVRCGGDMKKMLRFIRCLFIIILISSSLNAQTKKGEKVNLKSISGSPSLAYLTMNNVSTYLYNNGISDNTPRGDSGFIYPKGSGKTVFFQSGLLWGGSIDGYWGVGGAAYRSGLQPGRILPDGSAENQSLSSVRIYRVRSDYKNFAGADEMKLLYADEIAIEGKTADEIYAQYELDWKQWPAQYGAPFIDKDKDGIYNPEIDIPGMSENQCQTIWFVANDLDASLTQNLYGTLPMKIEMQATFWAFKGSKPEGNVIYRRYKIINRNSRKIDSMALCMWSDPDIGGGFDDYCGCDTTMDLGYAYNGDSNDEVYGASVPAAGFVMLQSPYIQGNLQDIAEVDFKSLQGFKNLGMTAFFMHSNNVDANWADAPQGTYAGALMFRNWFQGRMPISGVPFYNPVTEKKTKYCVSGDPVSGTGWIDEISNDRRIGLVSGSFTMNPNDTQQIIVAQIAAGGEKNVNNIDAVSILKFYTKSVKRLWKSNISLLQPASPTVSVSEFDSKLILNWSDSSSIAKCEKNLNSIYKFQGYNVYQFPKSTSLPAEGTRIATYDIADGLSLISGWIEDPVTGYIENKVIGFGSNSGIKRYLTVTQDVIDYKKPFYNYSKYYFGVTAYYTADDPETAPRLIESPVQIITAIPQTDNPGVRQASAAGDSVAVTHTSGKGDARVSAVVINPKKGDGTLYTISMKNDSTYTIYNEEREVFNNLSVQKAADNDPIVAGVQVNVNWPVRTILKSAAATKGTIPWSIWEYSWGNSYYNDYLWKGGLQSGQRWYNNGEFDISGGSSLKSKEQFHSVLLKFADTDENGVFNENDPNASIGYRFMENANNAPAKTEFAPYIINKVNFGFQEFGLNGKANIPVAAYDQKTGKRLAVGFSENNSSHGVVDGKYWPSEFHYSFDSYVHEVLFIFADEYSPTANQKYTQADREIFYNTKYGPLPIMYYITASRGVPKFSSANEVLISVNNPLTSDDKFTFRVPAVTTDTETAKEDADKINVFPNPYYGVNSQEGNSYQRFVTFTHLPQRVNIKIFNLAGQIVRKIDKDDASQTLRWNLATDSNIFVASGVYIAHIEMPDLGKVKILKFAVIIEQQYPYHY